VNKKYLLLLTILIYSLNAKSKIEPPNYNFSHDTLREFYPGEKLIKVNQKYKNAELIQKKNEVLIYKYYVEQIRYKFPVIVATYKDQIIEAWFRLPSYFLHDVFYQGLINRLGNPDKFKNIEINSIYIWNNKNQIRFVYNGSCTITCFPVFLHAISVEMPAEIKKDYISILDRFSNL
jgi:hypothetical protein